MIFSLGIGFRGIVRIICLIDLHRAPRKSTSNYSDPAFGVLGLRTDGLMVPVVWFERLNRATRSCRCLNDPKPSTLNPSIRVGAFMTLNPKPLNQNRALGLITLPSGPCFAKKTSSFVTLYIENIKGQ